MNNFAEINYQNDFLEMIFLELIIRKRVIFRWKSLVFYQYVKIVLLQIIFSKN